MAGAHAPRTRVHYIAAIAWLVFTVSLASWWLSVGLALTNRHAMFLWEGATFIVVLVGGGVVPALGMHHQRAADDVISDRGAAGGNAAVRFVFRRLEVRRCVVGLLGIVGIGCGDTGGEHCGGE